MIVSFNIFTALSIVVGFLLFKRQNSPGRLGGPICKAKGFWLFYTIYTWFFLLPFALWTLPDAPSSHRIVWATLTLFMWIRGIAEIYMLFVSKNWTPIIGISHDIFTFMLMIVALVIQGFTGFTDNLILTAFSLSLYISIIAETYYGYSFFQIMKGRTQGEDGLWYAHEDDPRFKKIILITTTFNYLLYGILIVFYLRVLQ